MKVKKENARSIQGITLIALIITIIVLLILAGVVISLTIGERGIFNTAQKSALEYGKSQAKEEIELAIAEIETEQLANGETTNLQILASGKLSDKLGGENVELEDGAITGLYKDYEYTIDENLNVTVGEKIKDGNEFQSALEYPILTQNGIVNAKSKNGKYYLDKNVDPKAGDAIGKQAYDGDKVTYYRQTERNDWVKKYIKVNSSAYGKTINIVGVSDGNGYCYCDIEAIDKDGNTIQSFGSHYGTVSLDITIPNNTDKLLISLQTYFYLQEISIK